MMVDLPTLGDDMSRRAFLQGAIAASSTLIAASSDLPPVHGAAVHPSTEVVVQSLDGSSWRVHESGRGDESYPAKVPGDIFTDLMAANKIPNPYFRDNNSTVQWVGKRAWRYSRSFTPDAEILKKTFVKLRCHGLDTLATVRINGRKIGAADNMYRTWQYDIKDGLKPGENTIDIEFQPTAPYAASMVKKYQNHHGLINRLKSPQVWVRKAPYMWGWDWCRPLLTCGIWKSIELIGFDARITDVRVDQNLRRSDLAILNVVVTAEARPEDLTARATVLFNGRSVAESAVTLSQGRGATELSITNPQLWWPNGMGSQHLYMIVVELVSARGTVIDTAQRRIGLRTIRYVPKSESMAVHLEINGAPFFAKGADWIPADNIPSRVTPEILRRYMEDARDCHFNLLRFWGGGYYESQAQFDACDELGLLVLFEFKFANHFYPVFDAHWLENVRLEVSEQVRLNRHHPCIALWSGNNEIYWFHGFNRLFRDTIGDILHKELPGANYELGSGDPGSSNDIHYWGPWDITKPPEQFKNANGFITEFGMQSFPEPATVNAYTVPADRDSIDSKVMVYHERSFGRFGIDNMIKAVESYFGPVPKDVDSTLWLTQIAQAYVIGYGVEHWRRNMPGTMATLIWQLNDSWPAPTWSMIDWYHRWKAIMYASKRFFSPLLASVRTERDSGNLELWVSSDSMESLNGELDWRVTNVDGNLLHQGRKEVVISPASSHLHETWNYAGGPGMPAKENVLIWSTLQVEGKVQSEACHWFAAPKDLQLLEPELSHTVSQLADGIFRVVVKARKPALWVWVHLKDMDAKYSDNFIHLAPWRKMDIEVRPTERMSLEDFQRRLEIRSVYDVVNAHR